MASDSGMPHFQTWEEFSRAAEKLYLSDPMKVLLSGEGEGLHGPWGEKWEADVPRRWPRPAGICSKTCGIRRAAGCDGNVGCRKDFSPHLSLLFFILNKNAQALVSEVLELQI